jgi:phosphatidylglycerophosphate synthase
MRKLSSEYDNFIDNIFIDGAEVISPYFYKLHFSPNDITTLSLITGLMCVSLFMQQQYVLAGVLYMISYFFDCMDGFYARKYKMTSDIGDLYDHFKDYLIFGILFYLLYQHHKNSQHKYIYLAILIVFILLCGMHFGCQEIYYDKLTATTQIYKMACPVKNKDTVTNALKYTKYFGCGTLTLFFSVFIGLTNYLK